MRGDPDVLWCSWWLTCCFFPDCWPLCCFLPYFVAPDGSWDRYCMLEVYPTRTLLAILCKEFVKFPSWGSCFLLLPWLLLPALGGACLVASCCVTGYVLPCRVGAEVNFLPSLGLLLLSSSWGLLEVRGELFSGMWSWDVLFMACWMFPEVVVAC